MGGGGQGSLNFLPLIPHTPGSCSFPSGSHLFLQNLYNTIIIAVYPLRKLTSLHSPPPPLLFSQDKILPVHKLAQHYDQVSSPVLCQSTEVSSILI